MIYEKKQAVVLSKINLILRKGETTGIVGENGVSYLFISHDLNLVRLFYKKIYELDRGELN